MRETFRRAILTGVFAAIAGAGWGLTQDYGYSTLVGATPTSQFGVTGKLEDCGAVIIGNGVTDGANTFFFPAQAPQGLVQVLTFAGGNGANPPQLLGGLACGTEINAMAWSGGVLVIGSRNEIIHATATAAPTSFTVDGASAGTLVGLSWDASKSRLFRLMSTRLEHYTLLNNHFVLRGSVAGSWRAFAVEPSTDTICLVSAAGDQISTYQWPVGVSDPTAGASVAGSFQSASAFAAKPSYVLVGRGFYRFSSFPAAPQLETSISYAPSFLSAYGALAGTFNYAEYSGNSLPELQSGFVASPYGIGAGSPKVAMGGPDTMLVAPAAVGSAQPVYRITRSISHETGHVQGFATTLAAGQKAVAVRFATAQASGNVRLAIYASPSADLASSTVAPMELKWQSAWLPVTTAGETTVPLPAEIDPGTGSLSLLVYCDAPGVLLDDKTRGSFNSFRLVAPNGTMPQQFAWNSRLQRSGIVGAAIVGATPVVLSSVSTSSEWTFDPYTRSSLLQVHASGDFQTLEVAENPGFVGASSYPTVGATGTYFYNLSNVAEGPHILYVRGKTPLASTSATLQTTITVDLTPPMQPQTPTDEGEYHVGNNPIFRWLPVTDDASGIVRYNYEARVNGVTVLGGSTDPSTHFLQPVFQSYTLPAIVHFRIQAVDNVANATAWTDWSDGIELLSSQLPDRPSVEQSAWVTNLPTVQFRHSGDAHNSAVIQMAENDAFDPPVQETTYDGFKWRTYDLSQGPDGLRPIRHRFKTAAGVSAVATTTVQLDRVAPIAEPPVLESTYNFHGIFSGAVNVSWRLPEDPEPSSEFTGADLEVVRDDDATSAPIFGLHFTRIAAPQAVRLELGERGGSFRARARGSDYAGNIGRWAVSDRFEINAKPLHPQLAFTPPIFTASTVNTVAATATDPDGDAIAEYRYKFWRTQPLLPDSFVLGNVLPASMVKKGEKWNVAALGVDVRGGIGWEAVQSLTIGNTLPTQPIVQILPRTPEPGHSLIVDVLVYSFDIDGDEIAYEFKWSKSTDNGATWIRKTELTGSSVDGLYINDGELWKVQYTPYEKSTAKGLKRADGKTAEDIIRVGGQNLAPNVELGAPFFVTRGETTASLRVLWNVSDPEGGPVKVDVYLTDQNLLGIQTVALGLDGTVPVFDLDVPLPQGGGPYYLYLVATDSVGNTTRVLDPTPIKALDSTASGWMLE